MNDTAPKRKRAYTGEKAAQDTSSLLSRLILFIQIGELKGIDRTTREFRDSDPDVRSAEKTITLAVKRGWITLHRKGNARVMKLGPNVSEVHTLIHILAPDVK